MKSHIPEMVHVYSPFSIFQNIFYRKTTLKIRICLVNSTITQTGGMRPPIEEWKRVLDEMNSKTARLEEDYEV